ncbi:hypothetical protein [Streptomyces ziwulingensis]|uniref:Uncharacterized protein n=1 Tax=Streptomyces ziwulingensis TaxID=1045501 RepID=A0ABP9CA50_9ACTN
MNARRRIRAKRRNLALARRLRLPCRDRPRPPAPPALPVRRPGGPGAVTRPPDGFDAHRPDTDLLRRVHAHLTDRPEP